MYIDQYLYVRVCMIYSFAFPALRLPLHAILNTFTGSQIHVFAQQIMWLPKKNGNKNKQTTETEIILCCPFSVHCNQIEGIDSCVDGIFWIFFKNRRQSTKTIIMIREMQIWCVKSYLKNKVVLELSCSLIQINETIYNVHHCVLDFFTHTYWIIVSRKPDWTYGKKFVYFVIFISSSLIKLVKW